MAVSASCSGGGGCNVGVQFLTTSPLGYPLFRRAFATCSFSLSVSGTSVQIFSARLNRVRATATLCAKG